VSNAIQKLPHSALITISHRKVKMPRVTNHS